jgi:hypothetical protein
MNKLAIGAIALVAVLGIGYVAADKLADNSAAGEVATYLKDHNLEKTITYKDVDYSLLNGTVTISSLNASDPASGSDMTAEKIVFSKKDLDLASGKKGNKYSSAGAVREIDGMTVKTADGKLVKIDKFTVDKYEVQDEIPTNVEMRMVGMHLPADATPNFPVKDPVINAHMAYGFDAKAKIYDVRDVSFDSNGVGSFAFSTQFKNFNVDRLRAFMKADTDKQSEMSMQLYQDFAAANLGKTVITFNDGGFVDLTLEEQAKTKNVSKEDIRKKTLAGLDEMANSPAAKPYADIIKAGRNLIAKSGSKMTITANPPADLTLMQLGTLGFTGDTQGLFQKLNITASN